MLTIKRDDNSAQLCATATLARMPLALRLKFDRALWFSLAQLMSGVALAAALAFAAKPIFVGLVVGYLVFVMVGNAFFTKTVFVHSGQIVARYRLDDNKAKASNNCDGDNIQYSASHSANPPNTQAKPPAATLTYPAALGTRQFPINATTQIATQTLAHNGAQFALLMLKNRKQTLMVAGFDNTKEAATVAAILQGKTVQTRTRAVILGSG